MKLIYCKKCLTITSLTRQSRVCPCKSSGGRYEPEGLSAIYWGEAVPLGVLTLTFELAIKNQPKTGLGRGFDAFVIPEECDTFQRVEECL